MRVRTSALLQAPRIVWPVVALLLLVLATQLVDPRAGSRITSAATIVPVSSVRLVCPSVPTTEATMQVSLAAVASIQAPEVDEVPPRVEALTLMPALDLADGQDSVDVPVPVLPEPVEQAGGAATTATSEEGALPVVVQGSGSLAALAEAASSLRSPRGDDRGLAEQSCQRPATSWWFAGASSTLGRDARIVLTNADDAPATVDVRFWDERGLVSAPGGLGVAVAARSRVTLRLQAVAPDEAIVAIHADVTSGRVHAAVLQRAVDGPTPLGIEFIPQVVPQPRVLVSVPTGIEDARLVLMAVKATPTTVTVNLRTDGGTFSPIETDGLTLTADTVADIPMPDALRDGGVLDITSDVPLIAAVIGRVVVKDGRGDLVAFGAAPTITSWGAVTGLRRGADHLVQVASVDAAATVRLTTVTSDGVVTTEQIDVPAGGVVVRRVRAPVGSAPDPARAATTIVLESTGPVVAMVMTTMKAKDGVMASSRVVRSRPSFVTLPAVRMALGLRVERDTTADSAR